MVVAGGGTSHLVVVVEELLPALAILVPHFDLRVVDNCESIAAQCMRQEDVLADGLIGEAHDPEGFRPVRAVAADQKILIALRGAPTGKVIQEFKEVDGGSTEIGKIPDADRAARGADQGIVEMTFQPLNPIRRNNAVLIREEDQASSRVGGAAITRAARRKAVMGLDQRDAGKVLAHNFRRRVARTLDDNDFPLTAARRVLDGFQTVGNCARAVVRRDHDRDVDLVIA